MVSLNVQIYPTQLKGGQKLIGESSFVGCLALNRKKTATVENIGARAFFPCHSLVELDFTKGLRSIGNESFAQCTSLKHIKMPSSLEHIGDGAFSG